MEHGGTEEVTAACAFFLPFRPASRMPWLSAHAAGHTLQFHVLVSKSTSNRPTFAKSLIFSVCVPNLHFQTQPVMPPGLSKARQQKWKKKQRNAKSNAKSNPKRQRAIVHIRPELRVPQYDAAGSIVRAGYRMDALQFKDPLSSKVHTVQVRAVSHSVLYNACV